LFQKRLFSPYQIIALVFLIIIFLGSIVLVLPISSRDGSWSNYLDCLFTSTSATCVTGLVAYDTYTHWSTFGHIIILLLIQIGGVGFMTVFSSVGMFLKRKINLFERKLIMQAAGSINTSGILHLVKRILKSTLIFEGCGALLLCIRFIPQFGIIQGIAFSIFHSISAFCNAGFDLMGGYSGAFSSLTAFSGDWLVNIVIMVLILAGGLGFLVWSDLIEFKTHFRKMKLHTKIVLFSTLFLILCPSLLFFLFEHHHALAEMPLHEQILTCLFLSISPRTAGFNTIDLTALSDSSILLSLLLMLIGGNPGSTAGGIKTTTFVVLILSIVFATKQKTDLVIHKRRLETNIVKQASAILTLYLLSILASSLLISAIDHLTLTQVLFETTSAVATVGLSLSITPTLSSISKCILIALMYMGRIGALSIIFLFNKKEDNEVLERPVEKILVG